MMQDRVKLLVKDCVKVNNVFYCIAKQFHFIFSLDVNTEKVEERKYISEDIIIRTGESLGLNNKFEYGQDKKNRIVYTKYVGLIDILQLENIIEDLLK